MTLSMSVSVSENTELEESIRNLEEQKKSSASEDENRAGPSKEVELEGIISNQAAELVFFKDKISQLEALQASSTSKSGEKSSVDTEDLKKKLSEAEGQNKKLKQLALKTKKEMDQTKKKLAASEEAKKKVEDQLKLASSKASSATSSFQTEYDRLQDELDQTKDERNNLQNEAETLKEKLDELQKAKEEKIIAKKEIERLTEKLTDTQTR